MKVLPYLLVGLSGMACPATWANSVYVALGDSITFGETNLSYQVSNGDRGYVADFDQILASRNGGVAPSVVNLAIDGETAASFLSGYGRTPPVVGRTDAILAAENSHYTGNTSTSQLDMFEQIVASEAKAGSSVSTISLTLGFNELGALATLPEQQALSMIPSTLATYEKNYSTVLSDIRALEPNATLYLLDYYNPFPANPSNPAAPIFAQAGPQLAAIIETMAQKYGAEFVYTEPDFAGNEAALTYLAQQPAGATSPGPSYVGTEPIGNVHPNNAGYAAIASEIAAVPEPSTVGLAGLFIVALGIVQSFHRFLFNR